MLYLIYRQIFPVYCACLWISRLVIILVLLSYFRPASTESKYTLPEPGNELTIIIWLHPQTNTLIHYSIVSFFFFFLLLFRVFVLTSTQFSQGKITTAGCKNRPAYIKSNLHITTVFISFSMLRRFSYYILPSRSVFLRFFCFYH